MLIPAIINLKRSSSIKLDGSDKLKRLLQFLLIASPSSAAYDSFIPKAFFL
jgi:hypothetical protein